MCYFCLPDPPNSGRAASKVEQNHPKLKKCSTAASKFKVRGTKSRTKSPKNWKNVLLGYLRQSSVVSDYGQISEITVLPVTEVRCSD